MTMHMCGPALSLNGKKKGKVKFRNAAEAQKARELDAEWKELLKRQGVEAEAKKRCKENQTEIYQQVQKKDLYSGLQREYHSIEDGGEQLPATKMLFLA